MQTRTRLTTPSGQEPVAPGRPDRAGERYVPGLAIPEEPRYAGRRRRLWVVLSTILVLVAGGYLWLRVATSGQSFDPALNRGTGASDQIVEQPTG